MSDGKIIIPGVIDSTSNFVEHPELVADRIVQYAGAVGRENVIAGNVIKPDDRGRNEALVAGPDGTLLATYHKLHPFRFANEHNHYRGGEGVKIFDWNGLKVSPLIRYDLRFPEAFRLATKAGAEMLVVIANWPTARVSHWLALLTARAIEKRQPGRAESRSTGCADATTYNHKASA